MQSLLTITKNLSQLHVNKLSSLVSRWGTQHGFHTSAITLGVPKNKPSLAVRRKRWNTQVPKPVKSYTMCSGCGEPVRHHNVCPHCNTDYLVTLEKSWWESRAKRQRFRKLKAEALQRKQEAKIKPPQPESDTL